MVEESRGQYWSRVMAEAAQFMQSLAEIQIDECGEPLVSIGSEVDSETIQVAAANDAGDGPREVLIRAGLVDSLVEVARNLRARGWLLRVEHAYRSPGMQADLVLSPVLLDRVVRMAIADNEHLPSPDVILRRASGLVANVYIHGTHISGSAVDTTVIDLSSGDEVDRGARYMDFSEAAPMGSPYVSDEARDNRLEITNAFERHGFVAYPYEFWHYSQGDAIARRITGDLTPARYGPVTRSPDGSVLELNPLANVVPEDVLLDRIQRRIAAAQRA